MNSTIAVQMPLSALKKVLIVEVMCACIEVRSHRHEKSSNETQTARVLKEGWLRYEETAKQR